MSPALGFSQRVTLKGACGCHGPVAEAPSHVGSRVGEVWGGWGWGWKAEGCRREFKLFHLTLAQLFDLPEPQGSVLQNRRVTLSGNSV